MNRLSRFDWLWVQLFMVNGIMILALKIWSFQQVLKATTWTADHVRRTLSQRTDGQDALIAQSRDRVRQIKRQGPIGGKCLSRSLALYGILRRYGVHSIIQIGVRSDQGEFTAHAWVEIGDQIVNAGPKVRTRHAVFGRSFGGQCISFTEKSGLSQIYSPSVHTSPIVHQSLTKETRMQEQLKAESTKKTYEVPKVTDYGTLKEQTASGGPPKGAGDATTFSS